MISLRNQYSVNPEVLTSDSTNPQSLIKLAGKQNILLKTNRLEKGPSKMSAAILPKDPPLFDYQGAALAPETHTTM